MRYLTIAADYTQSSLRDDFEGPIEPETLHLPRALCDELREWNDQYRRIIPLSEEARSPATNADLISRLDEQGQRLAQRVEDALKPEAKVRYYSEGYLRYETP